MPKGVAQYGPETNVSIEINLLDMSLHQADTSYREGDLPGSRQLMPRETTAHWACCARTYVPLIVKHS